MSKVDVMSPTRMFRFTSLTLVAALGSLGCEGTLGALPDADGVTIDDAKGAPVGEPDGPSDDSPADRGGHCEDCSSADRDELRATCETSRAGAPLLRRLTRIELENSLRDIFPELVGWRGVELSQDPKSSLGFSTDAMVLVVNGPTFRDLLETAERVADLVTESATLPALLPCSAVTPDRSCAAEFVEHYGLRLFRRPLGTEERERYLTLFDTASQASDFPTGIKWTLSTMLQSPHHFYRSEIGAVSGEVRQLTQFEIATNLAFTYSGTTPSPDLLSRADTGALVGSEVLEGVARELLAHPRASETAAEFFREWLGHRLVLNQSREQSANFAETIAPRLVEETERFLDHILQTDGTVFDLLLADYTFLDGTLSTFYGFGDVAGDEFALVTRPAGYGLGILGQGSLLAATSHQAETSPTLRGLLFTERFLCIEPPAPPAFIPPLEAAEGIEDAETTREKYEEHHAVPGCNNCHDMFDPYGFAFEQFDETGRYRATEHGAPINTVATVTFADGTQGDVSELESLSRLVETRDDVENCISGLVSNYMLSGAGGETCTAEEARREFVSGGISVREFMIRLAGAPHFRERKL